jgi:uncharacterized protein with NAD-binding domain and iron-sulfur cluster
MAGLAAAWRLSEPGWHDRFESITVHQRGWRLGGKGASSRGRHGRIEEHGLHLWLGFYENAFRLLRECYGELDRSTTDPAAPIRTWREALWPATHIGIEDRHDGDWHHWLAIFTQNDHQPGEPLDRRSRPTLAEYVQRALRLIVDFVEALPPAPLSGGSGRVVLSASPQPPPPSSPVGTLVGGARVAVPAALLEAARLVEAVIDEPEPDASETRTRLVGALDRLQAWLRARVEADPALRRGWHHVSLSIALVRGLVADGVLADPRRLRQLDDEDFLAWIAHHGAAPEAVNGAFLRGMYDLVLAYEGGDPRRPRFAAGTAVLITVKMLLDYQGAIFWKMAAGMGDVVFAPLYQALRARGVHVEFFSRIDGLHLDASRRRIDAISVGRQVRLRPGLDRYDPLVRVGGLRCFPDTPRLDQLARAGGIVGQPLDAQWCSWPAAERRVLRDGRDFDVVVLALPVGVAGTVCRELVADRPEWAAMVANLATVATQAFQLWLTEDERTLGWPFPGAVVSAFAKPFDTWASMPHLVDAEQWDGADRPRTIAYFCSVLDAPPPGDGHAAAGAIRADASYAQRQHERVRRAAVRFLERDLAHLLPGTLRDGRFRWELLCGSDGRTGPAAFDSQYWTANVDPSDRYVQSLPGTGRYRLRPDESGYDNLFLAGDWTDSGLNAGCIEAATLSGLQAGNAVLGRARNHRVTPYDLA